MNRRNFLQKGAVLVAAGLGVPTFLAETARVLEAGGSLKLSNPLPIGPRVLAATARANPDPSRRILVVIQMAGGNDGLNTLVPYADPLYYQLRPTIAVPRDEVLSLDERVGL